MSANRQHLQQLLGCEPAWMSQIHSSIAVEADPRSCPTADACWTGEAGVACAVLTADCLPVLLCDVDGARVAAVTAGELLQGRLADGPGELVSENNEPGWQSGRHIGGIWNIQP